LTYIRFLDNILVFSLETRLAATVFLFQSSTP
jgi:hypothetical protein